MAEKLRMSIPSHLSAACALWLHSHFGESGDTQTQSWCGSLQSDNMLPPLTNWQKQADLQLWTNDQLNPQNAHNTLHALWTTLLGARVPGPWRTWNPPVAKTTPSRTHLPSQMWGNPSLRQALSSPETSQTHELWIADTHCPTWSCCQLHSLPSSHSHWRFAPCEIQLLNFHPSWHFHWRWEPYYLQMSIWTTSELLLTASSSLLSHCWFQHESCCCCCYWTYDEVVHWGCLTIFSQTTSCVPAPACMQEFQDACIRVQVPDLSTRWICEHHP